MTKSDRDIAQPQAASSSMYESVAIRAARAVAKLKSDIEALATEVRYSDGALNDCGGEHTVIANGAVKSENQRTVRWPGLVAACDQSLKIATTMSVHHVGDDVVLFWRVVPEWEAAIQPSLYLRLSFAINGNPH